MPAREPGTLVIARCDNGPASFVENSRLTTSRVMAFCVVRKVEPEDEYDVSVRLGHIAGEDNVAPDLFSRVKEKKAVRQLQSRGFGRPKAIEPEEIWFFG